MAEIRDYSNNPDPQTADRWPEGMAMSSVNDTGRTDEGIIGRWEKDVDGSLVTAGTSTAYTLTPNRDLVTGQATPIYDGLELAFKPNVDCGDSPTLNVQATGAIAIQNQYGTNLVAGDLKADTPVKVMYSSALSAYVAYATVGQAKFDGYVPRRLSSGGSPSYDAGSADIPAGTTAEQPSTSPLGGMRYDTDTGKMVLWDLDSDGAGTPGWKERFAFLDKTNTFGDQCTFNGLVKTFNDVYLDTEDFGGVDPSARSISWRIGGGGQAKATLRGIGYQDNSDNRLNVEIRTGPEGLITRAYFDRNGLVVGDHRIENQKFVSAETAYTDGGKVDIAHGLGARPDRVVCKLRCKTAQHGFVADDEIALPSTDTAVSGVAFSNGATLSWDSVNIVVSVGTNGLVTIGRSGGSSVVLTPANWRLIATAWAENFSYTTATE